MENTHKIYGWFAGTKKEAKEFVQEWAVKGVKVTSSYNYLLEAHAVWGEVTDEQVEIVKKNFVVKKIDNKLGYIQDSN